MCLGKIIDLEEEIQQCEDIIYDLRNCHSMSVNVNIYNGLVDKEEELRYSNKYIAEMKQVLIDYFRDKVNELERKLDDLEQ